MLPEIPSGWQEALHSERFLPYFQALEAFLDTERASHQVYPLEAETFSALSLTPLSEVKVMILGQDPYHGPGQAHGLAFSVRPEVPLPASLRNIFKERQSDLGLAPPRNGSLIPWAQRGVLLLNAVLTVRAHEPNSHAGHGWEQFTDQVIRAVSQGPNPVVFVLWGAYAQKKTALIDQSRHTILQSPHPSPLSASRGFFGSKPFSKVNAALEQLGRSPIDWSL